MDSSTSSALGSLQTPGLTNAASRSLNATAPTAAQAASSTGSTALGQLTSNYSTFLKLLMTQLQNQDPTSPMDTNQFTTELVQFSSVEQQINTNTSLTQLIQLTQSGEILQSSSMIGHNVAVSGADMPVQNGSGKIQFTAAAAGPVTVAVHNSSGTSLGESVVSATKGVNTWVWNAKDSNGNMQPDGAYKISVTGTDSTGASSDLSFNAIGLATGVVKDGSNLKLQMGAVTTDFSNVQSVLD